MALALLGTAYLLLAAFAALHPTSSLWGIHLTAFLSSPARVFVWTLLVSGVALLAISAWRNGRPHRGRSSSGAPSRPLPSWIPWLVFPVGALILWALRVRTYFLGDQALWILRLREGTKVVYSEPLSAITWRGFRELLLALRIPVEPSALAVLPVLCGLAAIPLCIGIGRELSEHGRGRWFATLLLLAGSSQVYFGYVETYALASVAALLFLWIGLRFLHGRASMPVLALSVALAVSSHLVSLFLIPAYGFAAFRSPARPVERAIAAALPLALLIATFTFVAFGSRELLHPVRLIWSALQVASGSKASHPGAIFPPLRVALDLGNWLLLASPVPLMLITATVASRSRPSVLSDPTLVFLVVASLSGCLVALLLSLAGTPAQDWDLLAVCALPTLALGAALGRDAFDGGTTAARYGLLLLSAGTLLAFVLTNADPKAGLERFETLMSETSSLSPHERAYGNEKLTDYYSAQGNLPMALLHARRALAADSANGRYWDKTGQTLYRLGRYSEAVTYFEEAARRGGPKGASYFYAGYCRIQMGEPARAIPLLWSAVRAEPRGRKYWGALGLAYVSSGDLERGRAIWLKVIARWPDEQETRTAYRMVFGSDPEADRAARR